MAEGRGRRAVAILGATGERVLSSNGNGSDERPEWNPTGTKIVLDRYVRNRLDLSDLWVRNFAGPNGLMNGTVGWFRSMPQAPSWSPDGTRIAAPKCVPNCATSCYPNCVFDLFLVNADGTGVTRVTDLRDVVDADWQSIPINSYPRPRTATPLEVPLVPAYAPCTRAQPHPRPAARLRFLQPARAGLRRAHARHPGRKRQARAGPRARSVRRCRQPATLVDEADVRITVELKDVYDQQAPLTDYTGELRVRTGLRITDKLNTPHPGGPGAATVSDTTLGRDRVLHRHRRPQPGCGLQLPHERRRARARHASPRASARSGSWARCRSTTAAPTATPTRRPTTPCSWCRVCSCRSRVAQ